MSNEIDLDLDDSLNLDLGAEDAESAKLPDLSEESGLSLDLGDSSLELSSGSDELSVNETETADSGLDLTSESESDSALDLGAELTDSDETSAEDFSLNDSDQNDQTSLADEASLSSNMDDAVEDLQFSMNDSSLEEELDFSSSSSANLASEALPESEDDFAAKLAEIDSMLDDTPAVASATHDKTGDLPPATLAALQEDEPQDFVAPAASIKKNSGNRTSTHVRNQMAELDEMFDQSPKKANVKNEATQQYKSSLKEDSELIGMHGDELNRLAATISHLRDDRQTLVEKIEELERLHELDKRENLNLKSELEEKKIEISIIKKRFSQQLEEMKYSQQLLEEKKRLLEEKNSSFQKEYERLNHKVQIDIKKVQQREKELENQLDLLKVDAETQVRNRDNKILDLKRKIDSLEFDLEQLSLKENRNRDDKFEVEEKMDKLMKTLRSAITILEGDEQQLKNFDFIKKNLDI